MIEKLRRRKMKYENLIEVNQLYWNDMIELGKAFNIDSWKLIRFTNHNGNILTLTKHPCFTQSILRDFDVSFAKTVIEGVPVFKGDKVYRINGTLDDVDGCEMIDLVRDNNVMLVKDSNGLLSIHISRLTLKPQYKNVLLSYSEMEALTVLIESKVSFVNNEFGDNTHINSLIRIHKKLIGDMKAA